MKSRLMIALLATAFVCMAVPFVPVQPAFATDRTVIGELFGYPG